MANEIIFVGANAEMAAVAVVVAKDNALEVRFACMGGVWVFE